MTDETKPKDAGEPKKKRKKKLNPWVENIESLAVAVILALIIRTFVLEAFVIPTGSMASSLYGNHYQVACSNCGYEYAVGVSQNPSEARSRIRCPICGATPTSLPSPARSNGGDRILVNKVVYRFKEPERWDPFVFVNPNVRKTDERPYKTTYIKRLVGLPGDRLEIIRGDVVVDGEVARKPDTAQSRLWMPVYDSNYVWQVKSAWEDGPGWSVDGKKLVVDHHDGARLSWLRYKGRIGDPDDSGTIRDTYGYDQDLGFLAGVSNGGAGRHIVTDLKIEFEANGSFDRIELSLLGDQFDDRAVFDFNAGTLSFVRHGALAGSEQVLKSVSFDDAGFTGFPVSGDGATRVAFYRLDYLLVLAIDGRRVLEYDLWSEDEHRRLVEQGEYLLGPHDRSGVRLGVSGASLVLSNVTIGRDVYYTWQSRTGPAQHYHAWDIPEDCFFAMGDNSPESWDSRYWEIDGKPSPWVPRDHLIGKGLVIWWHPLRVRLIF